MGLIKKLEMNQLNYRLSHPVAALQTSLTKDMDKYSRIRFDYASFDAQVFGKQSLMGSNQDQEMSHFPDCKSHARAHIMSLLDLESCIALFTFLPFYFLYKSFISEPATFAKTLNYQLLICFLCTIKFVWNTWCLSN